MISQEDIMKLRNQIDIVDVVSSYIPLTSRGKNHFGVCPFHDDNNPSMSVSKDKQIYTCFSCGATGNVFKFIQDYENISFVEALKMCADKVGFNLNLGNIKTKTVTHYDKLYEIYDLSNKFYQNNIFTKSGALAKEYLNKRDLSDEVIKEFEIGLSLKDRTLLTKLLTKKEYDGKDLDETGLLLKGSLGYTDMYINRIMFPLYDLTGKTVGFSGRIYDQTDESKYINTRETKIFKKGELLYNYHKAKNESRIKNKVIIMEGFMDVIRAYTIDIKNAVASMGTAITSTQALLLKKMAKEVILCFDGDQAGAKATLACLTELEKIGVTPKIVRLEDNLDPDEYIKKFGKDKFLDKINNPMTAIDFKLSHHKSKLDLKDTKEMAMYVNTMLDEISKIEDDVLKEITINKIATEVNLEVDFIKNRIANKKSVVKIEQKPSVKYNKFEQAEQNLLFYMLKDKDVIKTYNKKITRMSNKDYQTLGNQINLFYKQYGYINTADLLIFVDNDETILKTINLIESLDLQIDYTQDAIDDYLKTIREYNVQEEIKKLHEKIKNASNTQDKIKYTNMILDIKKGESND